MAYRKPSARKSRTLDELAGNEKFTDKQGRVWRVRVFPLGKLDRVNYHFDRYSAEGGSYRAQAALMSAFLLDPCPDWFIHARRLLGLPDYSSRGMGKVFFAPDVESAIDAICKANFDMTLDELVERALKNAKEREEQKKK
jgi:hypothetical protein